MFTFFDGTICYFNGLENQSWPIYMDTPEPVKDDEFLRKILPHLNYDLVKFEEGVLRIDRKVIRPGSNIPLAKVIYEHDEGRYALMFSMNRLMCERCKDQKSKRLRGKTMLSIMSIVSGGNKRARNHQELLQEIENAPTNNIIKARAVLGNGH